MELTTTEKNKTIVQSNAITSARFDFTACQLDIFFMLLAKINNDAPDQLEFEISIKAIEEITGREWNHKQLREATIGMGSRTYEIGKIEDAETGDGTYTQFWLFHSIVYDKGSFKVRINDGIMPYFIDLKNNFTKMELFSVLRCSSKYAKRLYALACQWKGARSHVFEIEELRRMLYLEDEMERFSDFKKRVLDISKAQINEHTDLNIDLIPSKTSREFTHVKMIIRDREHVSQMQIDFKEDVELQLVIKRLEGIGFDPATADKYGKQLYKKKIFKKELEALISEMQQILRSAVGKGEKIENPHGYFVTILKNKGLIK